MTESVAEKLDVAKDDDHAGAETLEIGNWVATIVFILFFGAGSLFAFFQGTDEELRVNRIYTAGTDAMDTLREKEQNHLRGIPIREGGEAIPIDVAMNQIVREQASK